MYKKNPTMNGLILFLSIERLVGGYISAARKRLAGLSRWLQGHTRQCHIGVCRRRLRCLRVGKTGGRQGARGKIFDSCRLALRFSLQTQYTNENTFYLKNKTRAIGGFRTSLTNNELRCDNTQHAILALIKAVNYGVFP